MTCRRYQHCCCNPKCFQNTVPISFQRLTKEVLLWFSRWLYTKNFCLPHSPTFLHPSPHNSLQRKGWLSALLSACSSSSSSWGAGGVRRPGGLQHRPTGCQKPGRRATNPSQKCPVRLTLGLGEGQVPSCSLLEAEVGLQQSSHPTLLFGRTLAEPTAVQPRDGAAVWDGCTRCPKCSGSVELKLGAQLGKYMR